MSDEEEVHEVHTLDPEDAFGEALLVDSRNRRRLGIIILILVVAMLVSVGVLGSITLVRGQSIREGEDERRALREQLEVQSDQVRAQTRQIEVLTDEVVSIRADVDARRITDVCVSRLGGVLAVATAETLRYLVDPSRRGPDAPPSDPAILDQIYTNLDRAIADREQAVAQCDVG